MDYLNIYLTLEYTRLENYVIDVCLFLMNHLKWNDIKWEIFRTSLYRNPRQTLNRLYNAVSFASEYDWNGLTHGEMTSCP